MNPLKLSPVTEGTRWPSGDSVDLAVLPITEGELAMRIGLPLSRGVEDGWGPWSAIGGRLPSGYNVEFVCYSSKPGSVVLRTDKNASFSLALDEALQLVGLSRSQVLVSPLANG
jgi:hypothetical protein